MIASNGIEHNEEAPDRGAGGSGARPELGIVTPAACSFLESTVACPTSVADDEA